MAISARKPNEQYFASMERSAPSSKRLNVMLSDGAYSELLELGRGASLTELVRLALSLLKIALTARKDGLHLALVDAKGNQTKTLILPE